MKKFCFKVTFILLTLIVGISLVNSNFSQAASNDSSNSINDSKFLNYTEEEFMNMSEADFIEYSEWLEEYSREKVRKSQNSKNQLSAYSPQAGDILVTNDTQCTGGADCKGISGHSGIVLWNWNVLHIERPGTKPTVITRDQWFSRYPNTAVVRPNDTGEGYDASGWGFDFYVAGNGRTYDYSVLTTLNGYNGKTYCSKIVWQAYNNGAGKNLSGVPGFRLPYEFIAYVNSNDHKIAYTTGTW